MNSLATVGAAVVLSLAALSSSAFAQTASGNAGVTAAATAPQVNCAGGAASADTKMAAGKDGPAVTTGATANTTTPAAGTPGGATVSTGAVTGNPAAGDATAAGTANGNCAANPAIPAAGASGSK